MSLLAVDQYWFDELIAVQHLVNEGMLYIMCILLYLVSVDRIAPRLTFDKIKRLEPAHVEVIGAWMIVLVCVCMIFNVYVIVLDAKRYLKLLMVRRLRIYKERQRR